MTSRNNSEERLRSTEEECERLRAENTRLRAMLGIRNSTSGEYSQTHNPADVVPENRSDGPPAPEKKIALFRSLVRGREDAYTVRWGKEWQVWLFSRRCHGLARNPCREARGSKESRTEDANASPALR